MYRCVLFQKCSCGIVSTGGALGKRSSLWRSKCLRLSPRMLFLLWEYFDYCGGTLVPVLCGKIKLGNAGFQFEALTESQLLD